MTKLLVIVLVTLAAVVPAYGQSRTLRGVPGADKVVLKRSSLWQGVRSEVYRGDTFRHHLRFYSDGTVIGVTTTGHPNRIKRWFRRPYDDVGKFVINGSSILFTLTSKEGRVDYAGTIRGRTITVDIHSHINGRRFTEMYLWVPPKPHRRQS